ncbi:uncharacterized protein [Rutidosis leptorrhynchoides]|uniref:uncharacterized protein n=1 Tax=Rutidosis leptorrhynchoides TaxID=125765 RepID=UPI003A999EE5
MKNGTRGNLQDLHSTFKEFFEYKVGVDNQASFWFDPWLSNGALADLFLNIRLGGRVCQVFYDGQWQLSVPISHDLVDAWDLVRSVMVSSKSDTITCTASKTGTYTIASAYNAIREKSSVVKWARMVWGKGPCHRHSFIVWLVVLNHLAVKVRLKNWGLCDDDVCVLRGLAPEIIFSLLALFHLLYGKK